MWWLIPDDGRRNFHLKVVAELPQLFGRPRVLEENLIDVERIKLAGAVAIDGLPDAVNEFFQLCLVVVRDQRARRSSLRLVRHENNASHEPSFAAAVEGVSGTATLMPRFSPQLATVLAAHRVPEEVVNNEIEQMVHTGLTRIANRSVVGTTNDFSYLADSISGSSGRRWPTATRAGTIAHVIELPEGSWWDWDVLHFDGSELRLAAGHDLSYHHGLELVFTDVDYLACPTQFKDPRFREPMPDERAMVLKHVGQEPATIIAFDVEAAMGGDPLPCLVAAGSVEVVTGLVYR